MISVGAVSLSSPLLISLGRREVSLIRDLLLALLIAIAIRDGLDLVVTLGLVRDIGIQMLALTRSVRTLPALSGVVR